MPGTWIQTMTGRRFELLKPDADAVCIGDIAHSLSLLCRFAGHTENFYSVGQHSIIVSKLVAQTLGRADLALYALLHDAAEAYIGDISRPVKVAIGDRINWIETAVQECIWKHFGLSKPKAASQKIIHAADNIALQLEIRDLMGGGRDDWRADWPEVFQHSVMEEYRIEPAAPGESEIQFLESYNRIVGAK